MTADNRRAVGRSAARLGAVQALYQMDIAQTDLTDVLAEFAVHGVGVEGADDGDESPAEVDLKLLRDVVTGVVHHQRTLDPEVDRVLAEGWTLARVDSTLRAILRAAAYELTWRQDIPPRVTINEYVDVAHAFFDGDEPGFVNGALDRLARSVRAAEMSRDRAG